ncbi:hypothetical protein B6N60_01536 [Richelia sinica FACHB-800]|uniref:Uncharacterized protein n=1 Tax=Richelia sinica FACHB-800 TaxID=1357546 RepID=A0A975T6K4_9NOST|nr:hypothetical protein [Richelia sinica]MBD2663594.1 hypothetical protein [Richelia sinica FACHB-800]QXE22850.1 hypothetical protein B6N60_01536 [Richelia sinica FACHB-800]
MNNQNLTHKDYQSDPFIAKFFARVPPQTLAQFTDEQLAEIKRVFNDTIKAKPVVDIRLSFPFLWKRFYTVFLMGKETKKHRTKN